MRADSGQAEERKSEMLRSKEKGTGSKRGKDKSRGNTARGQ